MRVLTLDLGTGALKVGLWEDQARIAHREAPIQTTLNGPCAEQDARAWWQSAVRLTREIVAEQDGTVNVDVIGVTGQMHALVPTDADGAALGPVAIVSDRRAGEAHRELAAEFGVPAILRMTGGRLDPTYPVAKARHFLQAGEAAWRSAAHFLPPKDFLRMQLTGEAATDPIDAAGTLLWDLAGQRWHPDLCAFAGCPHAALPECRPTVSLGKPLTHAAAAALGLLAGTPVAIGGGDDIEALGAGAVRPGDLFEHLGTTGSVYVSSDRLVLDAACRVETYPDILPGRWLIGGSTSAAGLALRWALELTGREADWEHAGALFRRMEREGRPSDILFLPYLVGERAPLWDGDRAGALLGLRPSHGPDAVLQATIEGVLFALRAVLTALEAAADLPAFGPICAAGPLGAERALGQTRADIYGREVVRYASAEDATGLAAMVIATCAVTGEDPYELMMRRRKAVWNVRPRPEATERYHRAYCRYQLASEALASFDAAPRERHT